MCTDHKSYFSSLYYHCNLMSQTFDILNYELSQIRQLKQFYSYKIFFKNQDLSKTILAHILFVQTSCLIHNIFHLLGKHKPCTIRMPSLKCQLNNVLDISRDCWANPFTAEQPGCSSQTYQGRSYYICRYVIIPASYLKIIPKEINQ